MTAITAITAQNTVGVEAVEVVSPEMVVAQILAIAEDIGVDAVKIGMLGTAATIDAVVEALTYVGRAAPVVIDPVMVAESGAVLLDDETQAALVERLLPLAAVATPNIPEARELTGLGEEAARRSWPAACSRWDRRRSSSPAATARTWSTSSSTASSWSRSPASATPTAPRTAPAAPTPRRWPPFSLAERSRWRRRARRAAIASEAVGAGLREIGAGPGPVDALGLPFPD